MTVTTLGAAAPKLSAPRLKQFEFQNTAWIANLDEGIAFERTLDPAFWGHVANKLRPYDEISLRPADGSWYGRLLVVATGNVAARVVPMMYAKIDGESMANEAATHEIKHRGPRAWSIVRISDKVVTHENMATREEAVKTLADYLKALAA